MSLLDTLFANNRAWANEQTEADPEFFSRLGKQQSPDYLWRGCSDSRVPANQIINLPPGEVFVHRNIANVVVHSDLNCLSVIQFGVEVLKVKHIIVCGHYGCGGIQAALKEDNHGLINNWLEHIRDVARIYRAELDQLTAAEQCHRLCELNVIEQVRNVCMTNTIQNAWRNNQSLAVHGWIYGIDNGLLKDLSTSVASTDQFRQRYQRKT